MLARICHDASNDVKLTHLGWSNRMSNVPLLPQDERVFWNSSNLSGSKALLLPEQKNVLWMKDIMREFTLPSGLVVDCCDGTCSVAKAL